MEAHSSAGLTNHKSVFKSRDHCRPIRGQYSSHVIIWTNQGSVLPASVENEKGRHGQSLGVLGVREKHPTAIREPENWNLLAGNFNLCIILLSVQSGDLVEVDNQVLGGVQLLLLVYHRAADDRHQGCENKVLWYQWLVVRLLVGFWFLIPFAKTKYPLI